MNGFYQKKPDLESVRSRAIPAVQNHHENHTIFTVGGRDKAFADDVVVVVGGGWW
jgi:hypothetical protein